MSLNRSGEDYLETMLVLQKEKGRIRSADVARRLNVTRASVSYAVRFLEKDGFLTMDDDKRIILSETGQQIAEQIYARHCIIRDALILSGVEPEIADQDACRIEHDISGHTFGKLKELVEKHRETEE